MIRVLDLARFQEANPAAKMQAVDLAETFRYIASIFEAKAFVENIRLKIVIDQDPALLVLSDPDLLLQILQNLVANAIAYRRKTKDQSWVLLTATRIANDSIRISVVDNGKGIAPQMIEKIFEPYFQIDNKIKDSSNGVGLGLSFVERAVARLENHRIAVSSNGISFSKFSLYVQRDK